MQPSAVIPAGVVRQHEDDYTIPEFEYVALTFLGSYSNENTRKNYSLALKAWFAWCLDRKIDPLHDVRRAHVEFWMRHMENVDALAARTIAGRVNALSGYYRIAVLDGHIEVNPVTYAKRPRIDRVSTSTYLTRAELGQVVDIAEKRGDWRDTAILCLLGYNGLRVSELVGLDVDDIGRERGYKTIVIRGKGGYVDSAPLAPRTSWAVEQLVGDRTSGPIFTSKRSKGKRLTRADVQGLVKRYARWAGICKPIHPHSFRHSFVTLALDAGVPTRDVQNGARHRDPRSTAYYDRNRNSLYNHPTHRLSAFVEGTI